MRDRNALVTRDIRRESQHPVPSRPVLTRPALYIAWGDFSSCRPVSNPRTSRLAMMSEAKG
jgi:hypothetical protein